MLQSGADWSRIDIGMADDMTRVCKLVARGERIEKTFEIDERVFKRLPEYKILPVVLFEPNHLLLFHGSPERRRLFMIWQSSFNQHMRQFVNNINEYYCSEIHC